MIAKHLQFHKRHVYVPAVYILLYIISKIFTRGIPTTDRP